MRTLGRAAGVALLVMVCAASAAAQAADQPPDEPDTVDVFGFGLPQSERLKISGLLIAAWSHDGAQAQLGFEKQARVGQATLSISGRVTPRVRYLASFNPVNEVASKPACGEADFFFPNDPRLYDSGPTVPCDPEDGNKRVDTYNTYALDYVNQQGPLREGYIDFGLSRRVSMRVGRFILPIGFAPADVGSWTAKDLTRIQRLNAEANFGVMLAVAGFGSSTAARPRYEAAVLAIIGDGHRQRDYNWFYFANSSFDTNSAVTALATVRARPDDRLDLRVTYKHGFTGSKVERLPSYWASKRRDDALVVSARAQVHPWAAVFGEYARYVWGPTASSAALVGVDPAAIEKPGYYIGATFEVPVSNHVHTGVTVTREELSRDDSLVKYLATEGLYGVALGKKDRGTIARLYVEISRLVTVGFFWADISNPFPWVSGSWPVSGPRAFTGRAPDRYGLSFIVRTP
jgi:hypothetical protein